MTDNPEPHAYGLGEAMSGAAAEPLLDSTYCMGIHSGVEYFVHAGNGENRGRRRYSARIIGQNQMFKTAAEAKSFIDGYLFGSGKADGHDA